MRDDHTISVQPTPDAGAVRMKDLFDAPVLAGRVIGSDAGCNLIRWGVDVEGVMVVDAGALRLRPLAVPGWGRAGLVFGPFARRQGRAMAISLLSADNGSAPYRIPSLSRRIGRWLVGSGEVPVWRRLLRLPRRWRREPLLRRLTCWAYACRNEVTAESLGGCWAAGWFPSEAPADPLSGGEVLVGRGAGPENGHLLARAGGQLQVLERRLANVPLHLVVILRDRGAAYYLAGLPNAASASPYPAMRPLCIDVSGDDQELWAGLHQSAMGEIGFSTDSVVAGIAVADLPGAADWFGTAHSADSLSGDGDLAGTRAVTGGKWTGTAGAFRRTLNGAEALATGTVVMSMPGATGLAHMRVQGEAATMLWRYVDAANHWALHLDGQGSRLVVLVDGKVVLSRQSPEGRLGTQDWTSVQILDSGMTVQVALDGVELPDLAVRDGRHADATGFGLAALAGRKLRVRDLEVHGRTVPIPPELMLRPPWDEAGTRLIAEDRFDGPGEADLAGRKVPVSTGATPLVWQKLCGIDAIEVREGAARVLATAEAPVRRRLAYGIDWHDPGFADVTTVVVPPEPSADGICRGRGGLIFWQDSMNFLAVNTWLDTSHTGGFKYCGAVSSFFTLNGFEDIYDAVWTNVADGIRPGQPCELRIACDGDRYRVAIDGRPVLYRALSDIYPGFKGLRIRKVGLLSNWEWGHDTGSRFSAFAAHSR